MPKALRETVTSTSMLFEMSSKKCSNRTVVVPYSAPLPRNVPTTNLAKISSGHNERRIRWTNSRNYSFKKKFLFIFSHATIISDNYYKKKNALNFRVWKLLC